MTSLADANWLQLQQTVSDSSYRQLADGARKLPRVGETSPVKLVLKELVCTRCGAGTLIGSVHQRRGKNWEEVSKLKLRLDSGVGEAPQLGGAQPDGT